MQHVELLALVGGRFGGGPQGEREQFPGARIDRQGGRHHPVPPRLEELQADAVAFLEAFGTPEPPAPVYRSGGPRGVDVASSGGRGSVSAGAALYRERHGLDEDGKGLEKKPVPTGNRNPFAESGYSMER